MIITIIIVNMQNQIYAIQFLSPLDDRFAINPQPVITETEICELCKIPEKDQTSGQKRI